MAKKSTRKPPGAEKILSTFQQEPEFARMYIQEEVDGRRGKQHKCLKKHEKKEEERKIQGQREFCAASQAPLAIAQDLTLMQTPITHQQPQDKAS